MAEKPSWYAYSSTIIRIAPSVIVYSKYELDTITKGFRAPKRPPGLALSYGASLVNVACCASAIVRNDLMIGVSGRKLPLQASELECPMME